MSEPTSDVIPRYVPALNGTEYAGMFRINGNGMIAAIESGKTKFVLESDHIREVRKIERLRAALIDAIALVDSINHQRWPDGLPSTVTPALDALRKILWDNPFILPVAAAVSP